MRRFSEEFADLINEEIPRRFMRLPESEMRELEMQDGVSDMGEPPADGFIANYCREY